MLEGGTESMSDKIDQRIVEMSFENDKFEKGILESKNSLKEFSNALNKMGTGKEFDGLSNSLQSLSSSFSIMEQIGIGALRRIGEAAVSAGSRMLKHLTVDPFITGWTKYEQKTASVQTIMNATGKSIDEVNEYLDQLMWFSDETSYGFTDMTAALAQMTSSGGEVESLIPLITGVANATAYAGKGAAEFSRAMYNLNQSYGAGNLQYMDWRSLELAGVAGKDLKKVLIEAGKAMGTLDASGKTVNGTLVDIGNFGSTLQEKWANTKVMEKAFGKFSELSQEAYKLVKAGDFETAAEAMEFLSGKYSEVAEKGFKSAQQAKSFGEAINATLDAVSSGWMRTYEIMFGELDEATKNFTKLTGILWEAFASGAEARNEILQKLKNAGGIADAFQVVKNVATALLRPLQAVTKGFDEIFPPKTWRQWLKLIKNLKDFTSKLIISDETVEKIKRTFAGFFAVVDVGWMGVKFLGTALLEMVKTFAPISGGFLDITASIGDTLVALNRLIKTSGVFQYGLLAIKIGAVIVRNAVTTAIKTIKEFATGLVNADKPLEYIGSIMQTVFGNVIDSIKMGAEWIGTGFLNALKLASDAIDKIIGKDTTGFLSGLLSVVKEFIDVLINKGTGGLKGFGEAIKNLDLNKIATFATGGVLLLFISQLTQLSKSMTDVINTTNGFMTKFSKKLFGTQTKMKDLAFTFGVLSASLYVLSTVPWPELKNGLLGLASAIGIFTAAYLGIQAINVVATKLLNDKEMVTSAFNLVGIATGLAIMAGALKIISGISSATISKSVEVLGEIMFFLIGYQALYAYISTIPGQGKLPASMFGMGVGLLSLISAIALLDKMPLSNLKDGIKKLGIILIVIGAVEGVFALAARVTKGHKLTSNLFNISVGVLALVGVMKVLTMIDTKTLTKSIGDLFLIGAVFAGLEVMFGLASRVGGGKKFKSSVLSIGVGMLALVGLIKVVSMFDDPSQVDRGIEVIAKMAGLIAAIELVTAVSARIAGGNKTQKILGAMTLTLVSFTGVVATLGYLPTEVIDQGIKTLMKMVALIAAIELVTALASRISIVIDKSGNATKGGMFAPMIGVVLSIITLTGALALLAMGDQKDLRSSAITLSIAAAAISVMAISFGIMMRGLSTISKDVSNLKSIVQNLLTGFLVFGTVLIASIALVKTIKMVSDTLKDVEWSDIGKFVVGIGVVSTLVLAFTKLANGGFTNLGASLKSLVPGFAAMIGIVLATAGFFEALRWVLPTIDNTNWDSFNKFIIGFGLIGAMTAAMAALGPMFAALGMTFLPALGGVLTAITGVAIVIAAFAGLSVLMDKIFGKNGDMLINGIDKLVIVGQGLGRFFGAIAGGFKSEALVSYGDGIAKFAKTIQGIDTTAFGGVKSLADAILTLTGAALRDGIVKFISSGKNTGEIFGEQLKSIVKAFKKISVKDATQTAAILAALGPMANNLKKLGEAAKEIPNSGGFLGGFLGNNDVDTFGNQLIGFINVFRNVPIVNVEHTADIMAAFAPMTENLKLFARAADSIPNTGGFLGAFLGDNTIDVFGSMLSKFVSIFSDGYLTVESAKRASDIFAELKPMAVNLKAFAEAAQNIPNTGGFLGALLGDNNITIFASEISEIVGVFGGIDKITLIDASNKMLIMSYNLLPALTEFFELATQLNSLNRSVTLGLFAYELKGFVEILSKIDFTVVQPALKSLAEINNSFAVVGSQVLESALQSFENNKTPFQTAIVSFLDAAIQTVNTKRDIISDSFADLFKHAIKKSRASVKDFKELGKELVRGLRDGILSEKPTAVSAIENVSGALEVATRGRLQIESPSKLFEGIGAWIPKGLGNGIKRNSKWAVLAGINMAEDIEEAVRDTTTVHSDPELYNDIGSWIPKGTGNGILSGLDALYKVAKDMGIETTNMTVEGFTESLADNEGAMYKVITGVIESINAPASEAAKDLGTIVSDALSGSMTEGVNSPGTKATKATKAAYAGAAKDVFQIFKESIDRRREYNLISAAEEIAEWENFVKKYAEGTEIRLKADKELARLRFEYSKTWIDEEKYYKRLSLLDELAAWERVQARYKEGHEYRMQAEREIFRLKQEIQQAEYQNSLNWIDEEKYYGRLNAPDELAAWNRIQKRYELGTDERKKADREIFRLEKEINETNLAFEEKLYALEKERNDKRKQLEDDYYNKTKEIKNKLAQDIKSLENEYENAVLSRTEALYSTHGLFDKVEKPEYVSGFDLINNLEDQVMEFDKWQSSINALGNRGIDDGLISELKDMGPKSLAQIRALNRMTQPELDRYVLLWRKKNNEARTQALDELSGMKEDTNTQIKKLTREADIELEYYNKVWKDSLKQLNAENKKQLQQLEKEWMTSLGTISSKGLKVIQKFRLDWFGEIAAMISDTNTQMSQLQKATQIAKAASSAAVVGASIGKGLGGGIVGTTGAVIGAATSLIGSALSAMKKTAKTNSPSKEGIWIGEYIGIGLANGLHNTLSSVANEGIAMGQTALDSISMFVKDIPDLLNDDTNAVTIQPVLDLTNIKSDLSNMDLLLGDFPGLNPKTTMQLLPPSYVSNDSIILNDIRDALVGLTDKEVDLTGILTVQVTNDKGEIVSIAQTAIKDMLRRESR